MHLYDFYIEKGDILGANFREVLTEVKNGTLPNSIYFMGNKNDIEGIKDSEKAKVNIVKLVKSVVKVFGYNIYKEDVKKSGDSLILLDPTVYPLLLNIMIFCKEIDLPNISALLVLTIVKAYSEDPEIKKSMDVNNYTGKFLGLFPEISEEEKKEFSPLKYTGNSCYQDSVLFSLLAIKNDYVDANILFKNLEQLGGKKREIQCSKNKKLDIKYRVDIQKELNNITESIRGNGDVQNCSRLRGLLEKCPSFGGQKFWGTDTQDAGEYLQYLFSLFEVEGIQFRRTTYITNDKDEVDLKKMIKASSVKTRVSPIIMVDSNFSPKNTIVLSEKLRSVEDSILDKKNLFTYSDGKKYSRRIQVNKVRNADYVVFYDNRLGLGEERSFKKIIPDEEIVIGGKNLKLTAIVVHSNVHYTSFLKYGEDWYYYNDLSGVSLFGDFDKLLKQSKPNICTHGVLYFYT